MSHWKESETATGAGKTAESLKLRRQVKQAGDIEIPMDEAFYENLHDKIMSAIEDVEIKPASKIDSTQKVFKRHWRNVAQVTWALIAIFAISFAANHVTGDLWSSSHTVRIVQNEKQIIHEALEAPEIFAASMISDPIQNDFLLEVASQNLDQATDDQFVSMIREIQN